MIDFNDEFRKHEISDFFLSRTTEKLQCNADKAFYINNYTQLLVFTVGNEIVSISFCAVISFLRLFR